MRAIAPPRRAGTRFWPIAALLLALAAAVAPPLRAATPIFVSLDGDDASCNGLSSAPGIPANQPNCAFKTIAKGLAAVDAGGTINVGPGSYAELVAATKPVTLRGAKAGADARARSGIAGETILTGGVQVIASDVIVDGFLVQSTSGNALNGIGLYLSPAPGVAGDQVLNTIVQNNVFGIYLGGSGPAQTLIRHNAFKNNNAAGPGSGYAIYGDSAQSSALIDANSFGGHKTAAIALIDARHQNVTISNNALAADGSIVLANTAQASIAGNTIDGATGDAIVLGGSDSDVVVSGNQIRQAAGSAVLINTAGGVVANTGIQISGNDLAGNQYGIRVEPGAIGGFAAHFNRIAGNQLAGLYNGSGGAIDAENNWWGCGYAPGAGGAGCAGPFNGTSGPVDANPWLVLRVLAPHTLAVNRPANATADFTYNSDGADTSAAGHLPDGGQVAFAATLGTVAPASVTLANGQAQAVFTAGPTPGAGQVSATFDQQTVAPPIEIVNQIGVYVPFVRR